MSLIMRVSLAHCSNSSSALDTHNRNYSVLFSVALAACFLCILVHTRSALITFFGMLQIVLAIPIAWIIYYHALGLSR